MSGLIKRRPARLALMWILLVYLAMATSYSMLVPLGEAPDEVPHFHFMRYIAEHKGLPIGSEAGSEGFQPPLYYALGAALTGWIGDEGFIVKANPDFSFDNTETSRHLLLHSNQEEFPYRGGALAWHLGRLMSVLFGAITVTATYLIALELFPGNRKLALCAAAFNAFIPEFLFMSGAMNNDNAVTALSGMSLVTLLKLSKKPTIPMAAIAGLLIGLAILAKTNALVFLPLGAMAAMIGALRIGSWQGRITVFVRSTAMIGVMAIAVCGWWFWRNQLLHGDPLGWQLKLSISDLRQATLNLQDYLWLATGLFQSFWGRFGGAAHIRLGDPVYVALGIVSTFALAGVVMALLRNIKKGRTFPDNTPSFLVVAAVVFLIFAALIRWTMTYLGTDQARLIYPTLSVIAVLFTRGIFELLPRKTFSIFLFIGMFGVFAIISPSLFILPNYHSGQDEPAQGVSDSLGSIDGKLTLLGYETKPNPTIAGRINRIYLRWIVMSTIETDLWLSLQIVDKTGRIIYQKDSALTRGAFTTDTWKVGDKATSLHAIQLPGNVSPGSYTLRVGVHPFGSQKMVPVSYRDGRTDESLVLGSIEVVAP